MSRATGEATKMHDDLDRPVACDVTTLYGSDAIGT